VEMVGLGRELRMSKVDSNSQAGNLSVLVRRKGPVFNAGMLSAIGLLGRRNVVATIQGRRGAATVYNPSNEDITEVTREKI
jgi:hypothetical protein